MDNQWTNVEFCYGQLYDEAKLDSILASGRDFVIDAQNLGLADRESKIKAAGYVLQDEGYELAGLNDLYQFIFVKK